MSAKSFNISYGLVASTIFAGSGYKIMGRLFRVLSSGRFWMNVLLLGIAIFLIIQGVLFWLSWYTQHREAIAVPDLSGYTVEEARPILTNLDLKYEVIDSVYSDEAPRGVVIGQNPVAQKAVKQGRTIYLTMNSVLPEMVEVPDLEGKSKRIALAVLEISGLELNNLEYRSGEPCTDCVVALEHNGKPIFGGDKIRKGEKISLILGQESNAPTVVPNLLGLTFAEASALINSYSLNVGEVLSCSDCPTAEDTAKAYVINQRPEKNADVSLGTYIDLYLSTDTAIANAMNKNKENINQ